MLLVGGADRAGMVALGWDRPNSMGLQWCPVGYLEFVDGGKDADSYKLIPGGQRA